MLASLIANTDACAAAGHRPTQHPPLHGHLRVAARHHNRGRHPQDAIRKQQAKRGDHDPELNGLLRK